MKWAYEKEALGFYLTRAPPAGVRAGAEALYVKISIAELGEGSLGTGNQARRRRHGFRKKRSRKGEPMATFVLEDLTGTMEVTVPAKTYEGCKELLQTEAPILVTGRYETEEENGNSEPRFICSAVMKMDDIWNGVQ